MDFTNLPRFCSQSFGLVIAIVSMWSVFCLYLLGLIIDEAIIDEMMIIDISAIGKEDMLCNYHLRMLYDKLIIVNCMQYFPPINRFLIFNLNSNHYSLFIYVNNYILAAPYLIYIVTVIYIYIWYLR